MPPRDLIYFIAVNVKGNKVFVVSLPFSLPIKKSEVSGTKLFQKATVPPTPQHLKECFPFFLAMPQKC